MKTEIIQPSYFIDKIRALEINDYSKTSVLVSNRVKNATLSLITIQVTFLNINNNFPLFMKKDCLRYI